jgi:peptide/nickel transport system permease protein
MPAASPDHLPGNPAMSETPGGRLLTESTYEVQFDSVTSDTVADEITPRREVKKLGIAFWVAGGFLVVLIGLAVLAPYLPFVDDPSATDYLLEAEEGPSVDHWMGVDTIGRDVFSRVVWGGRVSLSIAFLTVLFGLAVGGVVGLTAGFYGGFYEKLSVGSLDIMLAFPPLILALALVSFLSEPGTQNATLFTVTLTLTVLTVPAFARISRATTLGFAQREFVQASRTLGATKGRVLLRDIFPNIVPPMLSFALVVVAVVIVGEGTLSFLGLSVSSPTPTWGSLINDGRDYLDTAPHISLFPCLVMFLTLLAFNYVGDVLRRRFDVKEVAL